MPPRVNITSDIHTISNLFALAFRESAPTVYVLRARDSTWPVSSIPLDLLGPKMIEWTTYKQSRGGELVEADNFAAAAIWYVSSCFIDTFTSSMILKWTNESGFRLVLIYPQVQTTMKGLSNTEQWPAKPRRSILETENTGI